MPTCARADQKNAAWKPMGARCIRVKPQGARDARRLGCDTYIARWVSDPYCLWKFSSNVNPFCAAMDTQILNARSVIRQSLQSGMMATLARYRDCSAHPQ